MLSGEGLVRSVGGRRLLDGLDLTLAAGETLLLRGPTGAGKSVALRALARLDPLDAGRLLLDGRPVEPIDPPLYRAQVCYLAQRPVLLGGTVEQELRAFLGFRVHAGKALPRELLAERLAALDRPAEFLDYPSQRLSGGEAQIVCLLRSLLLRPRILLLDEPTASTDPATTEEIERLVGQFIDAERALIWVTHDAAQAARIGGRELWLRDGRNAA